MKHSKINPISKKRREEKRIEALLTAELLEKCHGLCMNCGNKPDWRGLSKHEKIFRSHGGDPTDSDNCILVCGKCHAKFHGIIEK